MEKQRTILLVDMNAFFASVEQLSNASLRGKPVLVGGSPSQRSVVAAASYEARPYGISSGMSFTEALILCPGAILVEGNPLKYADTARRVFRICADYTDKMEVYSIDECFLDVTETQDRFAGAWKIAQAIKQRIRKELGLTCSIGIGPNKLLSKLAAGMKKPDGLTEIKPEDVKSILEDLPVEKLHGIGEKTRIRLARMGITTAGALGRVPVESLRQRFGILGDLLHEMGNGIDHSPVVPYYSIPDAKSMGHSYTLSRNTRDWNVIHGHLLRLSEMVGRRLREQNYAGRTITLILRYEDMYTFVRQKSIPEYLDDGYAIYKVAASTLRQREDDERSIRLVGVSVSNLVKGIKQLGLFTDHRYSTLLRTLDAINDKYGEFTIKRASLLGLESQPKTHGFDRTQIAHHLRPA